MTTPFIKVKCIDDGTVSYINVNHIVAVYPRCVNSEQTKISTTNGQIFTVDMDYQDVYAEIDKQFERI